jgi:DNA-binding MarR family transcriptional regulator
MTGQQGRDEDVRLRAWTDSVLSYNRLMAVLEREMQDGTGITLSQYDVLLRLAEAPGGRLKMTELAQAIVYSTGTDQAFRTDAAGGLVRREPSEHDRRVIHAVLTDDGMERLRAASAVHLAGVRRHFAAHSGHMTVRCRRANAGGLSDRPPPPPSPRPGWASGH